MQMLLIGNLLNPLHFGKRVQVQVQEEEEEEEEEGKFAKSMKVNLTKKVVAWQEGLDAVQQLEMKEKQEEGGDTEQEQEELELGDSHVQEMLQL